MKSYLSDRYQTVCVNDALSQPVLLEYGVPQGSVLGPKNFVMYTKPLGRILAHHGLSYHFYADDTQLYLSFKPNDSVTQQQAFHRIEHCLIDIETWMNESKLKLNTDKTEVILDTTSVTVGESEITSAKSVKNLGVMFDSTLSMQDQVNSVCKSCYMHLRNISRIRCYLTPDVCKSLVNSLVTSRLDYCNATLYGLPNTMLRKLQQVQNTAARIIMRSPRLNQITPILKELHWLPVKYRVQFKILVYAFKALNCQAPAYIQDMIKVYIPTRSLRSENAMTLVVPRVRTVTYGNRCFHYAAPSLWNALPIRIREAKTLYTFKKHLKTHLFSAHYG